MTEVWLVAEEILEEIDEYAGVTAGFSDYYNDWEWLG